MAQAQANGITIEYETFGDRVDPAVLLVMGLSGQLTMWAEEFCERLAGKGHHVIRFDNRDIGLSTKFDAAGMPDMMQMFMQAMTGQTVTSPYTLEDMAADAVGLLDALEIEAAHVVGASMGGMIAQLIAADHPQRTLSLTSIMSTTGNLEVPQGKPEAMQALMTPAADPTNPESVIARGVEVWRVIGSPGFETPVEDIRAMVKRDFERSFHPTGITRQMAAILANGDRRPKLQGITAPTLVIHGADDPLVPIEGGKDTAANIPGAELMVIEGMGHDFPSQLYDPIIEGIVRNASRSAGRQAAE